MIRAVAIFLVCTLYSAPLLAAELPLPQTPIYNPASKSYFQLFKDNVYPGHWMAARERASIKAYKGVRGRLAVVDSWEDHKFLLEAFGLTKRRVSVWIGLRYWCAARLLQWEDGRLFEPSEPTMFRLWHADWSRSDSDACNMSKSGKVGFAPVYYRTIGAITRWQAVGAAKYFRYYLVEFPTGGE
ncbi:C-type lectin domain-containing protein [Pelagibius marinus]|uniref:C-type lectin domain-containing protein n=1 Tax=Pelagibius marinus TaxID=2762760 RepID=UPI001873142F|nr:C-type lectin domain-containing protein [Pelagibius marinus]